MTRITLLVLLTVALITGGAIVAILIARGYEFNPGTHQITGTGILVATSDPNGAEVLIDNKLNTATNNTLNLAPGNYDIKIQLDGYTPWQKKVTIKKEEVFKTNAFLFPKVPDLRPLTLSGAANPTLSLDEVKIAYGVSSASAERNGLWVLDMGRTNIPGPLSLGGDSRQIFRDTPGLVLNDTKLLWNPDGRQVLAYRGSVATPSAAYLLDIDRLNETPPNVLLSLNSLLSDWDAAILSRHNVQMAKLTPPLAEFLEENAQNIRFSADETKILYEASRSATLPQILSTHIPGSNPTPESRNLTPGKTYVYDLKEDKNYEIENCLPAGEAGKLKIENCVWFPSSRHLLAFNPKEIWVEDYDGTNKATIYAGPFIDSVVFAWPNWSKIVILTSLNLSAGSGENLYTINLR